MYVHIIANPGTWDGPPCGRIHRFGEAAGRDERHICWDMTEESELSAEAAIAAFGLAAITKGLMRAFEEATLTIVLKEELESRLKALAKVLEALQ